MDYENWVQYAERLPVNGLELWILCFAIVMAISVLTCISTTFKRMANSQCTPMQIKSVFLLILTLGQAVMAHAALTRAFNGVWEEYYMMTGLSMWIGGRLSIILYSKWLRHWKPKVKDLYWTLRGKVYFVKHRVRDAYRAVKLWVNIKRYGE